MATWQPPCDSLRAVAALLAATDKGLALEGLARLGGIAKSRVVGGYVPPTQKVLAFFRDDFFEALFAGFALAFVRRQEEHADAVFARLGHCLLYTSPSPRDS